jgi:hypothetical protein
MSQSDTRQGIAAAQAFDVLDPEDTRKLLAQHQTELAELPADAPEFERSRLKLEIASDLLALEQKQQAWFQARPCLDQFIQEQHWQQAVECCDVLYQCEQDDPVAPETTVAMLQHIVDETPPDSDGAAVAAITAHYIADLRASGEKRDSLMFLTTQIIAQVARRHSQVNDQEMLEFWMERLELKDPGVFLPRLAKVLDIIVSERWWFDRGALRRLIPDN